MKILMIGWELPPHNSGGLGVACLGLAKALSKKGAKITFVLPKKVDVNYDFMDVVFADIKDVEKITTSYTTSEKMVKQIWLNESAPSDFVKAAVSYGAKLSEIAKKLSTDVIHSHDWLTSPAAISAKKVLKIPHVAHVHSTEFDRTGGHYPNKQVCEIEKKGLERADKIISISKLQKGIIERDYGIESDKISVVHNGSDYVKRNLPLALTSLKKLGYKLVLYLGRITLQKGPEYFIRAAKIVSEYEPKAVFIVTGSGDMQESMMTEAASLGIMDKTIFTGWIRGDEKHKIWQAADVYVMPSVSEPFGLTALESMANGTPLIVSKQSGVSEIINHVLKVDFWDVEEIANKIINVLRYPHLRKDLRVESSKEVLDINWGTAADKCMGVYNQLM